jgi:two-component system sensor histidine kinase BaeS
MKIRSLSLRLFLSYVAVVAVTLLVLVGVVQVSLPRVYGRHMGMMDGAAPGMMGMGMGRGVPGEGGGTMLYQNFRASFIEALTWAGLAALLSALLVSLLVSRKLAAPIRAMTLASQRISEGKYDERVSAGGSDEIGLLADSFNRMAAKLAQTEALRRQLIGDVAHELRTPLTAIKGSLEGLVDGVLPPVSTTFEQICEEADRLNRLVDDLQELSRVEGGGYRLDLVPIRLQDLVEIAVKRLARPFEAKGVRLTVEAQNEPLFVLADADRMSQVMLNLLGNALQYTPPGGKVTVRAEAASEMAQVSVTDTGIGIPPEHLAHIFDRFYRVDKSRSRRSGGGAGIGLTIARHLVEAHGGRIWAESEGEGRGSRFTFTLPLIEEKMAGS